VRQSLVAVAIVIAAIAGISRCARRCGWSSA